MKPLPSVDMTSARARIFVSYSRKDGAFADRLDGALRARNFEPLIDRGEIYAFEDWWKRIEALITSADTVVFVVSPDAVASDVALKEVAHAASLNKRLAPIICRRVDAHLVPERLRRLNFIDFEDAGRFDANADQLAAALTTDIGWIRKHTEFMAGAQNWASAGRPQGLLLRSPALEEAEQWIAARPPGAPIPSEECRTFLAESRRVSTWRRNALTGSLVAGLILAIGLAGLAYWQRGIAVEQRQTADEQRAAAEQQRKIADDQRKAAEEQRKIADDQRRAAELQRDKTLISESALLSNTSEQAAQRFDFAQGLALALQALPKPPLLNDRPFVQAALLSANRSLYNITERVRFELPHQNAQFALSTTASKLAVSSEDGSAIHIVNLGLKKPSLVSTVGLERPAYEFQFFGNDNNLMLIDSDFRLSVIRLGDKKQLFLTTDAYSSILGISPYGDIGVECLAESDVAVAFNLETFAVFDGPRDNCGDFAFPGRGRARSLASGRSFSAVIQGSKNSMTEVRTRAPSKEPELISPSQRFALFKSETGQRKIINLQTEAVVWTASASMSAHPIALTDSLLLLEGNNHFQVIDWVKKTSVEVPLNNQWDLNSNAGVAFSPDGRMLYVAASDGRIGAWRFEHTEKKILFERLDQVFCCHSSAVERIVWVSPDTILSLDNEVTLRLWGAPLWSRSSTLAGDLGSIPIIEQLGATVFRFSQSTSNDDANERRAKERVLGSCAGSISPGSAVAISIISGLALYLKGKSLEFCDTRTEHVDKLNIADLSVVNFALDPQAPRAIAWSDSTAQEPRRFFLVRSDGSHQTLGIKTTEPVLSGALSIDGSTLVLLMARRATQDFFDPFIRAIDLRTEQVTIELDDAKGPGVPDLILIDRTNTAHIGSAESATSQTMPLPSGIKQNIEWAIGKRPVLCKVTSSGGQSNSNLVCD